MRAVAAKASTQESTAKSQKKAAHNQTQPAAPANVPVIPGSIPSIQRKSLCPCDGGCPTCSGLQNQIQSLKGSGQSLSAETRGFFEPRFGQDFSSVRVHTDSQAAQLARSLNAKAFTRGKNIVFDAGRYSPFTSPGKHLLAHELTHVVQQNNSSRNSGYESLPAIQRSTYPSDVTTDEQRIQYLLGNTSPPAADWVSVTLSTGRTSYLRREVFDAYERMRVAAAAVTPSLPAITLRSAFRSFASQQGIWNRKMDFTGSPFGVFNAASPPVSTRCAAILNETDRGEDEWNPGNERHRLCWNALTEDERAIEILRTSSAPGTSRHHWGTDIDLNSITAAEWETPPLSDLYTWLSSNGQTYGFYQTYTSLAQRGGVGYVQEKWHWSYYPIAQPLLDDYRRLLFNPDIFEAQIGDVRQRSYIVSHYQEYVGSVATPPPPPPPATPVPTEESP